MPVITQGTPAGARCHGSISGGEAITPKSALPQSVELAGINAPPQVPADGGCGEAWKQYAVVFTRELTGHEMVRCMLQAAGRRVGTSAKRFPEELEGLFDKVIHAEFDAGSRVSDAVACPEDTSEVTLGQNEETGV